MRTYYHLTPTRNLRSIKSQGLVPGQPLGFASEVEGTTGKVFLGRSTEECREQFNLFGGNEPGLRVKDWALLRVDLSEDWPLLRDGWDYLYTVKAIPPRFITVIYESERKYLRNQLGHLVEGEK